MRHVSIIEHSKFSVMTGLIVEAFSCCSLFIMLCNGLKMSEYDAYWLAGFLIVRRMPRNNYGNLLKKQV